MKEKLKGFAKDSLVYGVGGGVGKLTAIILLPILSRIFLPSDYGVIDLLSVGYVFLFMTLKLNVMSGVQKFYFQVNDEKRKELLSSCILFSILFAVLCSLFMAGFAEQMSNILFDSDKYSLPIFILIICLPFEIAFDALGVLLRLRRRAVVFSALCISRIVMTTLFTYTAVVMLNSGIKGVFLSRLMTMFTLSIISFFYLRNQFSKHISFPVFKKVFSFSIPGQPGLIIKSVMNVLPIFVLKNFSTLTAVGLYGVAYRIASTLNIYVNAFQKAWSPFAFEHAGKEDERGLYETIFKLFAGSLVFFSMFFALFAPEALKILTPSSYHSAAFLVGGICLYLAGRGVSLIYSTIFYTRDKVVYTSYIDILQLVLFLGPAFFLVPRYAANGLIISLLIALFGYLLVYHSLTMRLFRFDVSVVPIFTLVLMAACGVCVLYSFNMSFLTKILAKIAFLIAFVTACYYLLFSKKEKAFIFDIFSQKFAFLRGN